MKENFVSDTMHEALLAYFENNLTKGQAEELIAWLEKDRENLVYLLDTGRIWNIAGLLNKKEFNTDNGWKRLLEKIEDDDIRPAPRLSFNIHFRTLARIAAAAIVIILVSVTSLLILRKSGDRNVTGFYETVAPKGSRSVITLSDGSKVWLNSGTTLRYSTDFGAKTRDLYLDGEAYFSVAENKEIPFRVKTSDVCITAVGTAFNVKAYNDENMVETTLEKGKVLIESVGTAKSEISQSPVYLKPNQKAVYVKSSGNLTVKETISVSAPSQKPLKVEIKPVRIKVDTLVDTRLTTSWKDSKWIFKSEKLNKLVPILERRYDITVSFVDTALCNYKFTGTLKEESLEQVLKALSLAAPIRFEVAHNHVFLYEDQGKRIQYFKKAKQQIK